MHSAYGGKGEGLAKERGVEIARSGRQTERSLKKFQKNKKKVCRIKKSFLPLQSQTIEGLPDGVRQEKRKIENQREEGQVGTSNRLTGTGKTLGDI